MRPAPETAAALRALAGLLRSGFPLRTALERWPDAAPEGSRPMLNRVRRRLALGASVSGSLEGLNLHLAEAGASVAAICVLHSRLGGDAAALLDAVATGVDERHAALESARALAAGATLSGRLIATLPFAFLALVPLGRAPLLDATGVALVVSGLLLGAGGLVWMDRLVPQPEAGDDLVAGIGDLVAALCAEGLPLGATLDSVAAHAPPGGSRALRRARRMATLGAGWPRALMLSGDPGLAQLASIMAPGLASGSPVADALRAFALSRRAAAARDFDRRMRRAPVLMVLPLALCVLPSFVLLGLAPLLRALSIEL